LIQGKTYEAGEIDPRTEGIGEGRLKFLTLEW
jgi:hypothetical protein